MEVRNEEDYDSEDNTPSGGYRKMTREESLHYWKMLRASDGFDVPNYPGKVVYGPVVPISDPYSLEDLDLLMDLVIKWYHEKQGVQLKLLGVITLNMSLMCPFNYHVTFLAEDVVGKLEIYQTLVCGSIPPEKSEVDFVRVKPNNGECRSTPGSSCASKDTHGSSKGDRNAASKGKCRSSKSRRCRSGR